MENKLPRYQFFYPGCEDVAYSDPDCSDDDTLDDAIETAESMVNSGTKEIIVVEIDDDDYPVRVVARVVQTVSSDVTVY